MIHPPTTPIESSRALPAPCKTHRLSFWQTLAKPASQAANRSAMDSLLEGILAAPFEAQAAKAYGPIRAAYKARNRDALDKLIASHAVALDVKLVTNNAADFVTYRGLVVENWINSE